MMEAYCVKCRKKVEIKNPIEAMSKKNPHMMKGKCPNCGTNVCAIIGISNQKEKSKSI